MPTDMIDLVSMGNFLPNGWMWRPANTLGRRAKKFKQKLKIKNHCDNCDRKFTSMMGLVEFGISMSRNGSSNFISCQLYQNDCKRCNLITQPGYYDDELASVILHVVTVFSNPRVAGPAIVARIGNPRAGHDKNRCEACKKGIAH